MLNTIDLEKRWLRYKIKSFIPHISLFVIVIFVAILAVFFSNNDSNNEERVQVKVVPKAIPLVVSEKILPLVAKVEVEKAENLKLQPSFSFMQKMQNSSLVYEEKDKNVQQVQTRKKIIPKKVTIEEIVLDTKIPDEQIIHEKKDEYKITIKAQETGDDIRNVIKRFKVNNNPALSLFIAKKSYALANYTQAYNYALITNNLNKEIEASWIIFSKSLVKLKKKDQAIKVLKDYIGSSGSNTAKILLEEIQSGKFN